MNATIGHSVANLSPDQQTWFHHNLNLAIKLRAVPFKPEELADDCWRGSALEHVPENIPEQFLRWLPQWPVPGIRGQGICSGAIMRNGAVFRGEGIPAKPPKVKPASGQQSLMDKARASLASGIGREAFLKVLRAAGMKL
jgi:hypothetical protein